MGFMKQESDGDMAAADASTRHAKVRVWDGPTRVTHWLIALSFAFSWYSAEQHMMEWHYRSGMLMIGLVVFRGMWGIVGSSTARFGNFVRGPGRVWGYARTVLTKEKSAHLGHNPLGGWSVVAMLALLATQVGTGLFAVDVDGIESGPLSWLVSFEVGRELAAWHHTTFVILQVLVVLHLSAIIFYLFFKRENLVTPMISGLRHMSGNNAKSIAKAPIMAFLAALLVALGAVYVVSSGMPFLG